ncbi:hypothetical protein NEOLEDRAFT_1083128 [Neolentinus lepideus HHB14362 ss-1]|uniref:LYR motif-containing protein Cup1-like N-terminal domain-containing protein n=1 Tax=Neolentinus lepideus HHB14362 ss-1 TaxID=1314782 RepID=A0A165W752_9AGAM|nr:hypothetical protein NEOLEDRAFT_1083128 [Neolentinus lepideus HHB14362 ss-1]
MTFVKSISYKSISSLYRGYLREIRRLPHEYLRLFFRLKARDDVEAISSTRGQRGLRERKQRRVLKEVIKLKAANVGDRTAFVHVLDLAYGRKGKLKWELLEPLLEYPGAPLPDPIIPNVDKSRPPSYSPEIIALLTSPYGRPTKPLTPSSLITPPILPPQVDPSSEEARLLGTLSKRREVNLRRCFFKTQTGRVYPPLQVVVREQTKVPGSVAESSSHDALTQAGIRGMAMQGAGVFEEVLQLADSGSHSRPINPFSSSLRPRFLRRRYRELLGSLPILTYNYPPTLKGSQRSPYEVSLASNALTKSIPRTARGVPSIDADDLAWIKFSSEDGKDAAKSNSRQRTAEQKQGIERNRSVINIM